MADDFAKVMDDTAQPSLKFWDWDDNPMELVAIIFMSVSILLTAVFAVVLFLK